MRAHLSLPIIVVLGLAAAGCHRHRRPANAPQNGVVPDQGTVQPQTAAPPALSVTSAGQALTRVTADNVDEFEPHLSPDGKLLVFVAGAQSTDANGNAVVQTSILGADPSTGGGRTIYTSANVITDYPTWTPRGSLVYVSSSTGTPSLVRALTDTPNAAFSVIADGRTLQNPSWPAVSPDGKKIALEATMNGVESIVTIGMEGNRLTVLGEGYVPSWSPDGKRLAFSRHIGNGYEIMLMDATTGSNLTQVTNTGCSSNKPKFSPDGRYMVFETNCGWNAIQGGTESTTWNLYAVKTDGTGMTQLTSSVGESGQPFWGKDGWIYFESNSGGTSNRDIWKLQPVGDLAGPAITISAPGVGPNPPKLAPGTGPQGPGTGAKPTGAGKPGAPKW